MAAEASDPSSPAASPADPSAPAPAPSEPGTVEAAAVVDPATPATGPIPFDRHQAILANTREKTTREIVSRVEQQFGGAIQFQTQMKADPIGTVSQIVTEMASHPEFGKAFISHLARTLSAQRQQAITPIDTEVGPVYTADQVQKLVAQEIASRVGPLEQERETQRRAAEAAQAKAQTSETVKARLKAWADQPGFAENESAIADKQMDLVRQGLDPWSALGIAYASVVPAKLQAKSNSDLVQEAMRKAQASTGHPATVAPIAKPRPKTFREALQQQGVQ